MKSYRSYKDFTVAYPNLTLTVDLRLSPDVVDLFYPTIRDRIFNILSESSIEKGFINYDSDKNRIEIKEAILSPAYKISHADLIECTIDGNIDHCNLFECKINNSDLILCKVYADTKLTGSKLKNCYIGKTSDLDNCYVFGKKTTFRGKMKGGIFREGNIADGSNIDSTTEIVDFKKI
jgi:hypothetical protein